MGFDNECILNIQSLPGEYFCPVCRTLIYPNEALQTQCTHLYCKPCLTYVAATTQACPYDGYLVTEADSKPLVDSNKSLAETIGKVTVHCLYHKSGCQWQGNLSECITHGTVCAYGNSPVVCNRCSTQIVHRQVQEHAQLCPSLQPTQQADSSLAQSSAATTQAVTQDPSAVSSAAPAAAPPTAVPPAATAGTVSASAVATSSAGATVAPSLTAAPTAGSQGQAVTPQTQSAEQYQQQLQYQQYYQQHYPGYNPYTQQYQQYGQYQQVYQQYAQPQMQVPPQNVAQATAQPAPYAQPQVPQPSQPQQMVPNQLQNQPHLPQFQAPVVQPQPQQNPRQSAPQIPQMQPQSEVPLQLPHPQAQPTAHTQVGNQQFAMPATQAMASQAQPHVQSHPPQHQQVVSQQQHPQMQHLPQHQHIQPQIQLNSQFQHQHPQVQQQSYPQSQVYLQPHAQHQNPSVHAVTGHQSYPQPQPPHQMPHDASLQRPVHVSHQQAIGPQHTAPIRPPQGQYPLQGQQPAMLAPQGTQHRPQHQQHAGHHAQRPPMHPSVPFQAPPQGFPLNTSVPSQTGQSYQQGMPSSQQMHLQPFQPHGPPFMQQQHVQTLAGRSMSYVAAPQQFQESGKLENATNASGNSEVSESKSGGVNFSAIKTPSLGDKNVTGQQNAIGNVRKDAAQTGSMLDGVDGSDKGKGKDEFSGQESNVSNTSNGPENGGSLQQASQQNLGALGSHVASGMVGPQRPSGPDRMLPQHMLHPGPTPYMQGQPNQMRPPKHSVPEKVRSPMQQQLYGSYQSEIAPRVLAPNQNQMPIPQPAPMRPDDGMIRPSMGGPLPGHHDTTVPPFTPENVGRPHPIGMAKSNGVSGVPLRNSRAFHEEGLDPSRDHFRPLAAYPGRHNVNHKDVEDNMKQFPGHTHLDGDSLQRGPGPFDGSLGRFDGFTDSLPGRPPFQNPAGPYPIGYPEDLSRKPHSTAGRPEFVSEFGHHRIDGMPRNPGPFFQGMTAAPGGLHKDQLGSGTGNTPHIFDNPEFPHAHLHSGDTFVPRNLHGGAESLGHGHFHGIEPSGYRYQGHMHPDDPNLAVDHSQHVFPQESGHFSSGGSFRNGDVGWCRICMFNCGGAEGLDLHVHTREHQQHAMDIVLKMKHDVAKRQKMNSGGPKSFNKKVAGKGNFRGNRR